MKRSHDLVGLIFDNIKDLNEICAIFLLSVHSFKWLFLGTNKCSPIDFFFRRFDRHNTLFNFNMY